jgi:hypothetical protein
MTTGKLRTAALSVAAAVVALLAVPASGHGAITIGSDMGPPAGSGGCLSSPCTWATDTVPGRTFRSPMDGVVVRWRVKGARGELRLRVLRPPKPDDGNTATGAGSSEIRTPSSTAEEAFDTRLPIQAGDRIALDQLEPSVLSSPSPAVGTRTDPSATRDRWVPPLADGETRTADVPDESNEVVYNADIEPDQDRDGLGDETQDPFPQLAGTPRPGRCANTILGGSDGRDAISGTPFGDTIRGQGGDDVLLGLAGADCLFGSSGDDRVNGGAANDRLSGASGDDRLTGSSGRDNLSGGTGSDRLSGGSGNDVLSGGGGRDRISCGRGRDRVRGRGDRLIGC